MQLVTSNMQIGWNKKRIKERNLSFRFNNVISN